MSDMRRAQVLYELVKKPTDPRWDVLPYYALTPGEFKHKWIMAAKELR